MVGDCKGEASVLSGEAGLEGVLDGQQKGERKLATELVGMTKPEDVKGWNSFFGSERTETQSSQGGEVDYTAA